MTNILKSWKTTLIAVIIAAGLTYKAFTVGFSIQDAVFGFIAIGFLAAKDGDKSHSGLDTSADTGGHPDPDKEEK